MHALESESPNRQRLKFLAEKWNNISENVQKEKVDRRETLEEKLKGLEDRTNKDKVNEENEFKVLDELLIIMIRCLRNRSSSFRK